MVFIVAVGILCHVEQTLKKIASCEMFLYMYFKNPSLYNYFSFCTNY